jgi:hypothetical protein
MLDAAILLAWFVGAVASACATCVCVVIAMDKDARIHGALWAIVFGVLATLSVVQAGKMLEQLIRGIQ